MGYRLTGVAVRYGARTALAIDDLSVPAGRVTAVLGPNGSGKSTLLHVLAVLRRPEAGRVEVDGADPWAGDLTAARRRIGYVMQRPYLYSETVLDNVAYPLRLRGAPDAEAKAKASLERWGAGALAARPSGELSGGEVARVALARALAAEPSTLLLDEPSANLDRPAVRLLEDAAVECAARGLVVVLATHDAGFGLRVAGEVVHLREGRPSAEALENVLPGRVVRGDGRAAFESGGASFDVTTEVEGPAVATIDPEQVILSRARLESSARNSFPCRIRSMEDLGAERVRVRLDGPLPLVAYVTSRSCRELDLRIGGEIVATFKATGVRVR